ncbi:anthrax toxin-like adenylyl cyclase domain-containing protein [Candidatus Fukatsuia endosymbiont of Tuberolachnus salignus]|uniref:anthrax toxin-like adenylyl cyclase domain-containing protein n=1 Tax=Candidatus Fukatsuia endosymbiont of Tuberolachnus salignus TaxID=3077957 RepID=UPI00313EECB4
MSNISYIGSSLIKHLNTGTAKDTKQNPPNSLSNGGTGGLPSSQFTEDILYFATSLCHGAVAIKKPQNLDNNNVTYHSFDPISVEGQAAIKASGMVAEHVSAFAQLAKEQDTYFIFRPVNGFSTSLIAEGAATKGLDVHGKSSDWGPMAGYIPFDQNLSKKLGDEVAVAKGNQDNQDSLQKKSERFAKTQLYITPARLNELQQQGLLKWDENRLQITELSKGAGDYQFRLVKHQQGYLVEYRQVDMMEKDHSVWRSLELMGQKIGDQIKPLTADYDLFMVAPKLKEIINSDEVKKALKNKGKKFKNVVELITTKALSQKTRRTVDPEMGSVTSWMPGYLAGLNNKAKEVGYTGGNVVNHGSEMDNPFPESDQCLFVISPEGKVLMTKNWQQTQAVIDDVKERGYIGYSNRNYNALAINEDINGNQQVKIIPWGEALPSLEEFDQYLTVFDKISGSNAALNDLKMIRNQFVDYYADKKGTPSIQAEKIRVIREEIKGVVARHSSQSEGLSIALDGLYQRIDVCVDRILHTVRS